MVTIVEEQQLKKVRKVMVDPARKNREEKEMKSDSNGINSINNNNFTVEKTTAETPLKTADRHDNPLQTRQTAKTSMTTEGKSAEIVNTNG